MKPNAIFTEENADVLTTPSKQCHVSTTTNNAANYYRAKTACHMRHAAVSTAGRSIHVWSSLCSDFTSHFLLLLTRACDCTFTRLALALTTPHRHLHSPNFQPLTPLPTLSTHNTTVNIPNAQHRKPPTNHPAWPPKATPATPPAATTTVTDLALHHTPHHAVARTLVALSWLLRRSRN